MLPVDKLKVLILGATGMLGTDIAHELAGKYELYLWDKEELDITQEKLVKEKIHNLLPQVIINATGYTNVDGAEEEKDIAMLVNAQAVKYITEVAQEVGAKLVHFSTEYVFDGKNKDGYDEQSIPNPINVYGQSKLGGEKHVLNYDKGYLIRTSWLYGHAPQVGKPRGMNFIDTMLKLAETEPTIKVVNDQFGKLTNTQDLAQAVSKLISGDYAPGIYHLVNESEVTWFQVAQEVFKIKNITTPLQPITSDQYPTRASRPAYAVLLNTKFSKMRSWQEALRDYLKIS